MEKQYIKQLDLQTRQVFELLLKESPPSRDRKFALVKLLLQEEPLLSREKIEIAVSEFYKLNYARRTSAQFRRSFAVHPYPWLLDQFILSFRTAFVSETRIFKTASTIRHLIKNVVIAPKEISSVEILHLAVHRLTKPRSDQIDTGIGFEHLCHRWRDISFIKFGCKYEYFFDAIEDAIQEIDTHNESGFFGISNETTDDKFIDPEITQTDLDWFKDLLAAFENNLRPPLYPMKKGPQIPVVLRIEKLARVAHRDYPMRHEPLEEAVTRSCLHYLRLFRQEPQSVQRVG